MLLETTEVISTEPELQTSCKILGSTHSRTPNEAIICDVCHLPVHVTPSPAYPVLQVQVKLPSLFAQVASVSQPPLFVAHSLTSAQKHEISLAS